MRYFASAGIYYRFTTITGRIVALNIASLLVLVIGMLYLSDFRNRLIEAARKTLRIEASVIARSLTLEAAPKASEMVDDPIFGQPLENSYTISLEKSSFILRSLTEKTKTRGYIYAADGTWLADTEPHIQGGKLTRIQPATRRSDEVGIIYQYGSCGADVARREPAEAERRRSPVGQERRAKSRARSKRAPRRWSCARTTLGETILSLATPIEKGGKVLGALLLLTADGEIDATLAEERSSIISHLAAGAGGHDRRLRHPGWHHRRSDAPAGPGRRKRAQEHQEPRDAFPIIPTGRTKSATSPGRCRK